METIGYILAGLTAVYLWTNKLMPDLFFKEIELSDGIMGKRYRLAIFGYLDRKPINCGTCICFWLGIGLFIWKQDIFFLSLPLYYKLLKL